MPAGSKKGHPLQQTDLNQNAFKWVRNKYGISAVSAQKEKQEVIAVT